MTVERPFERTDRDAQPDLRAPHVGRERQQLADARCLCGAPLRLHFTGLVVGRGARVSCAVARYLMETGR